MDSRTSTRGRCAGTASTSGVTRKCTGPCCRSGAPSVASTDVGYGRWLRAPTVSSASATVGAS
eukprot:7946977-Lingulodinium_polyedra.AAC.1